VIKYTFDTVFLASRPPSGRTEDLTQHRQRRAKKRSAIRGAGIRWKWKILKLVRTQTTNSSLPGGHTSRHSGSYPANAEIVGVSICALYLFLLRTKVPTNPSSASRQKRKGMPKGWGVKRREKEGRGRANLLIANTTRVPTLYGRGATSKEKGKFIGKNHCIAGGCGGR